YPGNGCCCLAGFSWSMEFIRESICNLNNAYEPRGEGTSSTGRPARSTASISRILAQPTCSLVLAALTRPRHALVERRTVQFLADRDRWLGERSRRVSGDRRLVDYD